jgi:hypothetical protein
MQLGLLGLLSLPLPQLGSQTLLDLPVQLSSRWRCSTVQIGSRWRYSARLLACATKLTVAA